jgi:hypothetical protein
MELYERLRAALADRYTSERELGRGGMVIVRLPGNHARDHTVALGWYSPKVGTHQNQEGGGVQQTPALVGRSDSGHAAALRDCTVWLGSQRGSAARACGRIRHMDALVWLC